MGGNPRTVAVDTWFTWDGVSQRLPRGQVMDVTPGSALERAIGPDRLVPLGAAAAQPPAAEAPQQQPVPQQEPPAAPARPRAAAAKKQDDARDGDA